MDAATLVRLTLEERLPIEEREYGYLQRTLSPKEWIRSMEAWIDTHNDWPALPDSALQREDWYGDRG